MFFSYFNVTLDGCYNFSNDFNTFFKAEVANLTAGGYVYKTKIRP